MTATLVFLAIVALLAWVFACLGDTRGPNADLDDLLADHQRRLRA